MSVTDPRVRVMQGDIEWRHNGTESLQENSGKIGANGGEARGGTTHMKGVGMLVVSLRGVNFIFWSHLVCSGQNPIIFSREGLV